MKKTKQTPILARSKTKFLESYNPSNYKFNKLKTFEDAIESKTPSLNLIIRAEGRVKKEALVKLWLINLNELLNVKHPMSEQQIRICASLIVEDYASLKIADLGFFFRKIIKGEYGQFYESISIEKILSFLTQYETDRFKIIEDQAHQEHLNNKNAWGNIFPIK